MLSKYFGQTQLNSQYHKDKGKEMLSDKIVALTSSIFS